MAIVLPDTVKADPALQEGVGTGREPCPPTQQPPPSLPETLPQDLSLLYPRLVKADIPPAWQDAQLVEAGLVMEGGSMRSQFTNGILDYLMYRGLMPTTLVTLSAGALSAVNYVAGMIGRSTYLNLRFADDKRYYSKRSWLIRRSVFDPQYGLYEIPQRIVPLDYEAFRRSPISMYSVALDIATGQADYHRYSDLELETPYLQASLSLPLVSRIVRIDGRPYLDGGMLDSLPIRFSMSLGLPKQVVILTQPPGFIKPPNRSAWLARLVYWRYPKLAQAMANRHNIYNETYRLVEQLEQSEEVFVFRPSGANRVANIEHDRDKIYALYREGYELASQRFDELQEFLSP